MPPQQGQVRFDSDSQNEFGAPPQREGGMDIVGGLVSAGLVKSRQEAQYVLVAIAVLALVVGAYFFFHSFGGGSAPPPPPNMAPNA